MNTSQQRTNHFQGIIILLVLAWLLFGNGWQVVLLLTQTAQQRLAQGNAPIVLTVPTASVVQPTQGAASIQPGQLQPLTLDGSAPAEQAPSAPLPTSPLVDMTPLPTAAPQLAQQEVAPQVAQQPQPTATSEAVSAPLVAQAQPHDDKLVVTDSGALDWAAMAATARAEQPQPTQKPMNTTVAQFPTTPAGYGTGGGSAGSWDD